jgi:hypothetical protein
MQTTPNLGMTIPSGDGDPFDEMAFSNALVVIDTWAGQGPIQLAAAASGNTVLTARVAGDAQPRWFVDSNGKQFWGLNGGVWDTSLARKAAGVLQLNGSPPAADNSTAIATTAYVQAQGYLTAAPVTTVFGRAGAVVAAAGDYTAAQVTNAADKSSPSVQGFSGALSTGPASAGLGGGTAGVWIAGAGNDTSTFNSAHGLNPAIQVALTTDTVARLALGTFGSLSWSSGTATADVVLARSAAGVLALTLGTGLGYGTGTGGTITCAAGGSATLNKATGTVTGTAAVANGSTVNYTINNSTVGATDVPIVVLANGVSTWAFRVSVVKVAAGQFVINFENNSGASVTPVFNFALMKGATA